MKNIIKTYLLIQLCITVPSCQLNQPEKEKELHISINDPYYIENQNREIKLPESLRNYIGAQVILDIFLSLNGEKIGYNLKRFSLKTPQETIAYYDDTRFKRPFRISRKNNSVTSFAKILCRKFIYFKV